MTRARASILGVLLAAVAAAACAASPPAPYLVLGPGVEPLRAQFNRDAGHVRIVVLAAPT